MIYSRKTPQPWAATVDVVTKAPARHELATQCIKCKTCGDYVRFWTLDGLSYEQCRCHGPRVVPRRRPTAEEMDATGGEYKPRPTRAKGRPANGSREYWLVRSARSAEGPSR